MRNGAILAAAWAGLVWGQAAKGTSVEDTAVCEANAAEPSVTVQLPGSPFRAVVSQDGCWVFVSLGDRAGTAGIAVLKRSGGTVKLAHVAHTSAAAGIVLTHDGKLLVTAENSGPRFFDVASLTAGTENPALGFIATVRGTPVGGSVYVNVTADDERLFGRKTKPSGFGSVRLIRAQHPVNQTPVCSQNGIRTGPTLINVRCWRWGRPWAAMALFTFHQDWRIGPTGGCWRAPRAADLVCR